MSTTQVDNTDGETDMELLEFFLGITNVKIPHYALGQAYLRLETVRGPFALHVSAAIVDRIRASMRSVHTGDESGPTGAL